MPGQAVTLQRAGYRQR
jgi:ribosomal protein S18 acetylase RimI-like enzyme